MIRVLLVDDHPTVRAGIRLLLEQTDDIRVVGEADRGNKALHLAKRLEPDVILLDMEMPGKSGLVVAQELRASGLPVRILAVSAYDDEQYVANLFSHGAAGYLTKEEAPEAIVDAVRKVAQGEERWLSNHLAKRVAPAIREKFQNSELAQLTTREEEIVQLLAQGYSNAQISTTLNISERTVRFHLSNIYEKLNVSSRAEAIQWAQSSAFKSFS